MMDLLILKVSNKTKNPINGWINLHKPLGMSSAQAVGKVKWLLKPAKIGHAGTLDPLASGILPLALGEATKCVNLLMDAKKIYEFSVTFGESRATDDAEGEITATSDVIPTISSIQAVLGRFIGEIEQTPPIYSAIKVDGARSYDLARAGEAVALKSRKVNIYELELLGIESAASEAFPPQGGKALPGAAIGEQGERPVKVAHFRALVGKGTYIRSLGRDIALAVGSVAYISKLHRAAVGPFTQGNAISLDFLEESVHKAAPAEVMAEAVLPLTAVLDDIPALGISDEQHHRLRHGQTVMLADPIPPAAQMALLNNGQLVALAECDGRELKTLRILNV